MDEEWHLRSFGLANPWWAQPQKWRRRKDDPKELQELKREAHKAILFASKHAMLPKWREVIRGGPIPVTEVANRAGREHPDLFKIWLNATNPTSPTTNDLVAITIALQLPVETLFGSPIENLAAISFELVGRAQDDDPVMYQNYARYRIATIGCPEASALHSRGMLLSHDAELIRDGFNDLDSQAWAVVKTQIVDVATWIGSKVGVLE